MGHTHSSEDVPEQETAHDRQDDPDTQVTLQHIQKLYPKFTIECPSGDLHLHEFKRIFGLHHNATEEESAYMENVFRSFDTNGDGYIDFMEYIAAVHLILRGKLRDKLAWSFKVFDRDGNGCLDREEVRLVIKVRNNSGFRFVLVLTLVSASGQISLDEFIEGAEKDPWVMEQLHLDIGPCEWFMEHQENKH
uniref:EF-hand domain-containing protein n=1 Tax=Neogobius melanostomus TaxID=47308 RepID=A0A8C6TIL8_9GOBI